MNSARGARVRRRLNLQRLRTGCAIIANYAETWPREIRIETDRYGAKDEVVRVAAHRLALIMVAAAGKVTYDLPRRQPRPRTAVAFSLYSIGPAATPPRIRRSVWRLKCFRRTGPDPVQKLGVAGAQLTKYSLPHPPG
jgi:hypothetical protein